MNFTWANELAKNALKTAQKRIDSVLDITAEDEAESEEAVHNVIIPSVNESLEELQLENHDVWNEASTSFCSVFDGTSTVEVVCSEPNPIRDNDLAELLPCSPCSNSPEELVCSVGDQDVQVTGDVQQSNGFSKLEPNVLEDTKHVLVEKSSQKTDKHHDDTLTLISSDFEILRPGDASSMVSSVPKILPVLKESALTVTTLTEVTKEGNNGNLVDKQAASADIMHLKTQLQYQERRIRDLQFQNQRLEAKSNELLALKAVRTQQSSTEAKLMKILSEKETKLADLLREGEKLAETNGKLTKELKKLRNNLVEQEQLAKQNDEMRTDRDLACEEVRSLTAETTKLRNLVKSLESDLVKLKLSNDSLIADLNRRDIEIKKLEGEIQQSEANRESALKEVKNLQAAVEEVSSQVRQNEMSSRNAQEITQGLAAELHEEKKENERKTTYINSLEKRLEEMMELQQKNAQAIASVSNPLLESIQNLEEKISMKDDECEKIIRQNQISLKTLKLEKDQLVVENEDLARENEKNGNDTDIEQVTNTCVEKMEKQAMSKEGNLKKMKTRSDFIFLNELGEGSFSTVYHVKEKSTGMDLAAKVCFKRQIIREKKIDYIFREKEALIRLTQGGRKHPFIPQIMCTFQDSENLYIIMTLAEKGDLQKLLRNSGGKLSLDVTRFFCSEIVVALEHMHSLGIIHRDLKPENILITVSGHILITDFGSSKILDRKEDKEKSEMRRRRTSFVGTAQFVSPEVLKGESVQQACDYWALGVIIYQLLVGEHAFHDKSEYLIYQRIVNASYKIPHDFPESAANIVKKLLVVDVRDRLGSIESGGAKSVKDQSFFTNVNWDIITETEAPQFLFTSRD